jgi:hypothetical protein
MLSFEPELERLRPLLPPDTADALLARERREVFSVHPELRLCAWGGAMLLATAAGIVLKNNIERIGPVVLACAVAAIAFACYAFVTVRRGRGSLVDDSVLLLGALLVSADVAFVETQFHLFGAAWYRHFLILAVVHGAGAYAYRSRALLSLALTALCAWLGVTNAGFDDASELALRAFGAAAVVLMWRTVDLRVREGSEFAPVFESFAAGLAALGGCALMTYDGTRPLACLLALAIAAAITWWGYRQRREVLTMFGFLYGVVAVDVFLIDLFQEGCTTFLLLLVSLVAAIAALFVIHARFRELRA